MAIKLTNPMVGDLFKTEVEKALDKTGDTITGQVLVDRVPTNDKEIINKGYADSLVVTGVYTGDEKESQFIELGFTPSAVFVERNNGSTARTAWAGGYGSEFFGGLALKNRSVEFSYNGISYPILSIEENGFNVYFSTTIGSGSERGRVESNSKNTFYYIAWR